MYFRCAAQEALGPDRKAIAPGMRRGSDMRVGQSDAAREGFEFAGHTHPTNWNTLSGRLKAFNPRLNVFGHTPKPVVTNAQTP